MLDSLIARFLAAIMLVALMVGMIHGSKMGDGNADIAPITKDNFDFSAWNSLIQRYVVPGVIDGMYLNMVDYYKISLDSDYLKVMMQLESANTTGFNWSQYHAFWINAYNFAIVRTVIEHPCKMDLFPGGCGPITSIRQCGIQQPSATVVIWTQRVTTIANQEMSITDIVQKLHVPPAPWKVDPRYHSALSAASVSAPDLSFAFGFPNAELLDLQLNQSMHTWLANPLKGSNLNMYVRSALTQKEPSEDPESSTYPLPSRFLYFKSAAFQIVTGTNIAFSNSIITLDAWAKTITHKSATNQLLLSQTFRWDLVDWNANGRSIWWWLHLYGTPLMKAYRGIPTISYMKFDWNLNGEVGALCGSSKRLCYPWWGLLITVVAGILILLLIIVYCYCTRALKRKAFRDYMKANDVIINDTEHRWTENQ